MHIFSVEDLNAELLGNICSYLPKTSIYLFACAVSAPSSSWYKSRHLLSTNEPPQLHRSSESIFKATRCCHVSNSLIASLASERRSMKFYFERVISSARVGKLTKDQWEETLSSPHPSGVMWRDAKKIWNDEFDLQDDLLPDIFKLYCYYMHDKRVIDFVDLPIVMTGKITDEDICAILMMFSFFSEKNPKEIYLTDCDHIRGYGLEPIKFFTSLDTVDLSTESTEKSAHSRKLEEYSQSLSDVDEWEEWAPPVEPCVKESSPREFIIVPILRALVDKLDGHMVGPPCRHSCPLRVKIPDAWNKPSRSELFYGPIDRGDSDETEQVNFSSLLKAHHHSYNSETQCCYFGFQGTSRSLIKSLRNDDCYTHVDKCKCHKGYENYTSFSACDHCGKVQCLKCTKAEYKIWECNKCATTTCYDCRRRSLFWDDDLDDIVTSCDEHAPCSVEKDQNCLLCMGCRLNTCRKKYQDDEYCCLNCRGWAFNHLLKLTTPYILREDGENMSVNM